MDVQFWGAAREVSGSMHLLTVNDRRVLLDCGLYHGSREEEVERNRNFPFDPGSIDVVILSHAHIDHCGNLPTLVKAGFDGPIYTTSATRDLCAHMLLDSAEIHEYDAEDANRRREEEGKEPIEPLYTRQEATVALERFRSVEYYRSFRPVDGLDVRLRDAGHILGSASVHMEARENGRTARLNFSGDIGRRDLPILRDPDAPEGADVLIMESTYGDRVHEPPDKAREILRAAVQDVVERGGMLLIPAFALGRTQEIVYQLNALMENGELPGIDVFVDSPLATDVTEVFRLHPECFDDLAEHALLEDRDADIFGFGRLRFTEDVQESIELNHREKPAVIIASSGMCTGGRIVHHLKFHGTDPDSLILFVGYQAEGTLGRRILDGERHVSLYGDHRELRARVQRADSYSAHADRNGLLAWARKAAENGEVKRIFLVHGEGDVMRALSDGLREQGAPAVEMPERGQTFALGE
ncbi:MAG: MBL fold metallo-hydrolase RNA specificity domain-containing protein [Gemmatimonadota bacterium]